MNSEKLLYLMTFISTVFSFASCSSEAEWKTLNTVANSKTISVSDSYYKFDKELPIGISGKDSILFINFARSEYALAALNINTKSIVDSFGKIGRGPNEISRPELISQTGKENVLLSDINSKKIMEVAFDKTNKRYSLIKTIDYPKEIHPVSDLSLSDNFATGRYAGSADSMFLIYNRDNKHITEIPFHPEIPLLESRRNYFYAVRTAVNEKAGKIIAANYFFNMFHVYSLDGSHIQSFGLSENPIPPIDRQRKEINLENEYTGIQAIFPTESFCYLMVKTKNSPADEKITIVQIDWNGALINSFQINEQLIGGFYVDDSMKRLFAIIHYIDNTENEIFEVVSYLLE